ncbi:terminase small subunit [Paracoccus sp. DMF]|uniref:terminase small subunit n=1 Tax=Paracoccus sp. DMF TaxID=400837 RepID=UPI0011042A86|nr:terminase small subunit [Paracoccus sp. DMF]MCV2448472.1 terminase small subunit [Paracoccus sp. DMF]
MASPAHGPANPDDPHGLTERQRRFVEEYMRDADGNASAAARRAGYAAKSAGKYAAQLMGSEKVMAAIAQARAERAERTKIDADYVLRQAVKLHERCMQEIEPFTDRAGDQVYDKEGRPIYIFNATGAAKALELVGKHVGVQAFRDKLDVSNPDGSMAPRAIDASKLSMDALRELMGVIDETPAPDGG